MRTVHILMLFQILKGKFPEMLNGAFVHTQALGTVNRPKENRMARCRNCVKCEHSNHSFGRTQRPLVRKPTKEARNENMRCILCMQMCVKRATIQQTQISRHANAALTQRMPKKSICQAHEFIRLLTLNCIS